MIKIVHISPIFWDNWTYQENFITKIQSNLGYDVNVISSKKNITKYSINQDFSNEYYIDKLKVHRLDFVFNFFNKFYIYKNLYKLLSEIDPDIIMLHGLQSLINFQIIKYLRKNKRCKFYADIHSDYDISATNFISKIVLHKLFWNLIIVFAQKYLTEIYYTRPSVKEFIQSLYNIPEYKLKPLYLGTDYFFITNNDYVENKINFRNKYNISKDDIVLCTGGKITDKNNITPLINYVKIKKNIKLLIFGNLDNEILTEYNEYITYVGWLSFTEIHQCLISCDLIFFLGNHSVLWEQAVALNCKIILNYRKNREYLNFNTNILFLYTYEQCELNNIINNNLIHKNKLIDVNKNIFNFNNIVNDLNKRWQI